jgi:L-ascorbate metabolism protein UlaG (beta-lactamase superfamily)
MQVEWYGQSAFRLTDGETTIFIDPFGDISSLFAKRGMQFEYPQIEGVEADLLLVTHEHRDHNGVGAIGGDPVILRSTAGKLESPIGEVLAVASEHDEAAGTERGPNTIFAFTFAGMRVAHFGDFGQSALRDEQATALGQIDLAFLPIGDGPTIGADQALEIAGTIGARIVVPMHYRTPRIGFLQPPDAFLERIGNVERVDSTVIDTDAVASGDGPVAVMPTVP